MPSSTLTAKQERQNHKNNVNKPPQRKGGQWRGKAQNRKKNQMRGIVKKNQPSTHHNTTQHNSTQHNTTQHVWSLIHVVYSLYGGTKPKQRKKKKKKKKKRKLLLCWCWLLHLSRKELVLLKRCFVWLVKLRLRHGNVVANGCDQRVCHCKGRQRGRAKRRGKASGVTGGGWGGGMRTTAEGQNPAPILPFHLPAFPFLFVCSVLFCS